MELEFLKEVLSVPTVYGHETKMVEYIIGWGIKNHIPVILDSFGNVYLKKGKVAEGEHYPCVMAHMDTVHHSNKPLIKDNLRLNIIESKDAKGLKLSALNPIDDSTIGIGGDDKAGVAICLDIIKNTDVIFGAFFLSEEIGCVGAFNADENIFKEVAYAIEFDAPFDDWLTYSSNRTQLFTKEFFKEVDSILLKYGISNIRDCDPYTDAYAIKKKFDINCMNFFAGYYLWHTPQEYVIYEDVVKAYEMGMELIKKLGNTKHVFEYRKAVEPLSNVIFD